MRKSGEEIINSSAYKMLESMIQDRVEELLSCQKSLDFRIEQAKNPSCKSQVFPKKANGRTDFSSQPSYEDVTYSPSFHTGTPFDRDSEGNEREIKLTYETRTLKQVRDLIDDVVKLEEEIEELNREKLYLVAPDSDWDDGGRRYKRVFGKM